VKVLWDANNTAHIAKHGIAPDLAEKIIEAGNFVSTKPDGRYFVEATIDDRHYRLVCDVTPDIAVLYPVTAFPLRKRKY
jgi:hypothetical protein